MKSSDLPILQFFSKRPITTSNENSHTMVEDIADDDDDDEDENEECLLNANQHDEDCTSKLIHNDGDDDNSNSGTTTCPVCQKMLLGDNDKINKHIDLCLNGEMVRSTIKEEDQRTSPQANHSKRYLSTY
jgi:hypothetical protein